MESVPFLVVGAGISGLSFANAIRAEAATRKKSPPGVLVVEADKEVGGYCKTVERDGFVWDYSGHFFHFKHKEIEAWLVERMPPGTVRTVDKRSYVRVAGRDIDFPFQKNIHQLDKPDFIDCLVDLFLADENRRLAERPTTMPGIGPPALETTVTTLQRAPSPSASTTSPGFKAANFKDMLERRFGRGICDRFLVPYNEKLYATDLATLDVDAMGRFFPHADVRDIVRNMRTPDNASYNSSFTYPKGGAIEYVRALMRDLPAGTIALDERLTGIDLATRTATTTKRKLRFGHLVTSAPLAQTLAAAGIPHDASAFTWNRVLVFNLGFDKKGRDDVHWLYFPDRALSFYRVGYYDNIHRDPRMSLYVEIGLPRGGAVDVEAMKKRVLADLSREGIVRDQQLVASHSVVMDPAYVHITKRSLAEVARVTPILNAGGVHSVGRYGGWTYCSIEDNIVETQKLASVLGHVLPA